MYTLHNNTNDGSDNAQYRLIPNHSNWEMNEDCVVRHATTKEVRPLAKAKGGPKVLLSNDNGKWRRHTLRRLLGMTFPPDLTGFKPKIGYPQYLINWDERVWSTKSYQFLKYSQNAYGHKMIRLSDVEGTPTVYAHHIVWEWYHNETTEGYDIDHWDDNPKNNLIGNLRKVSRSQNLLKASERDRLPKGERHHSASITNSQAWEIKYLMEHTSVRNKDLCGWYSLTPQVASDIRKGRSWVHIKVAERGEMDLSKISIVKKRLTTKTKLLKMLK